MVCPEGAAANLVRSRASHHLHLSCAPSCFSIDSRCDDSNLIDQIGADVRVRKYAEIVSAVRHHEAVSRGIDRAEPRARKEAFGNPAGGARSGGGQDQIQNIARREWQVLELVFRKNRSHRRRCRRDERVGRSGYLNGCCH